MDTTVEKIHAFEKAGLGKAPFRIIGYERKTYQSHPGAPVQVGGSCDYCSTGIIDTFWVKSVDGKEFKVGSSCINKCGDSGLKSSIKKYASKIRKEKEQDKINAGLLLLEDSEMIKKLESIPHSKEWLSAQGKTKYDEIKWYFDNAGNRGKLQVCKFMDNLK